MSGRRLREAVKQELESEGGFRDSEVVIAGLSNVYTHYITTYEEYQVQRYEGASTIYGPHTLSAYLQKYRGLARAIAQDRVSELPIGPQPPFFEKNLLSLLPAASIDKKPVNSSFGDVLEQVYPVYRQGDVVSVTFVAGNPRNSGDIRDKTFVTVEIYDNRTNTWKVVHTDASWETRFHWLKGSNQQSNSTVEWYIPPSASSGSYRIKHFGHYKERKNLRPVIKPYEGTSNVFKVATSFYYE
ncbi:Neutral ceramidase [Nibea albiflora]|uniref:Neutral ceramidase n=1 Tax=Nibea albiflora TaxID=240163 RepID=A0ACB7F4Z1_NIBAL|nr:Neutral ceramidase [Nibea albiflora]